MHYQEVEDSTLVKSIDTRVTQKTDLYLMKSQVYLKDDMIGIFDSNELEHDIIEEHMRHDHYSLNRFKDSTAQSADREVRKFVEINLRAASIMRVYKREVVDMIKYFGNLGGLIKFLLVIG